MISSFFDPAMNDVGQAAFRTSYSSTSGATNYGILFYDDVLGLLPVVRLGDTLLGGTIVPLDFNDSAASDSNEQSGINNSGQVAYQFILADGRSGIAIWSVPEPTSVGVLFPAIIALARRRPRYKRCPLAYR